VPIAGQSHQIGKGGKKWAFFILAMFPFSNRKDGALLIGACGK
jgi:hypothetical protein